MTLSSLQHLVRAAQALADGLLMPDVVRARIEALPLPAEALPRPLAHLRSMAP